MKLMVCLRYWRSFDQTMFVGINLFDFVIKTGGQYKKSHAEPIAGMACMHNLCNSYLIIQIYILNVVKQFYTFVHWTLECFSATN